MLLSRYVAYPLSLAVSTVVLPGCIDGLPGSNATMPGSGLSSPKVAALTDASPSKYKGLQDLYVSDAGTHEVAVLDNKTYKEVGTISSGLSNPGGNFLDKAGNLYVASGGVQEYSPGGTSPSFTYDAGLSNAIDVSVDTRGNVYAVDLTSKAVIEYHQQKNAVVSSCSPGGVAVEGVAVDQHHDVFASVYIEGVAEIIEYAGGLRGCNGTVLGASFKGAPGGMAVDKNDNIIVCAQAVPAVYVIEPPYASLTKMLGSGYADPFHVTLSRNNAVAFVADGINKAVYVLDYPRGDVVTTLSGGEHGLSDPVSAVDGPNAVY